MEENGLKKFFELISKNLRPVIYECCNNRETEPYFLIYNFFKFVNSMASFIEHFFRMKHNHKKIIIFFNKVRKDLKQTFKIIKAFKKQNFGNYFNQINVVFKKK